jgi:hypothetical protein
VAKRLRRPNHFREGELCWGSRDRQASLKSCIGKLFADRPWLRFVIVSKLPPDPCGFRPVERSPVAHWHLPNDQVRGVVPEGMAPQEAAEVIEAARRGEATSEGHAVAGAPGRASKSFGEAARPEWV